MRIGCAAALTIVLLSAGCAGLPPRPELPHEPAPAPASSGPLAELALRFAQRNGTQASGFHLLVDSRTALEARLALVDTAVRSIDLQYFIWEGDEAGTLLFERLLQAADRGVRIRIIVDDIGVATTTPNLAALNSHPHLEIRVFNPNPARDYPLLGLLNYLASFRELNRRMHNKLMVADNRLLIAGGRNIGNAYFGLGRNYNFLDIDVLSVGAVVEESSAAYDDYWNDRAVYPVSGWRVRLAADTYDEMRRRVAAYVDASRERLASFPLQRRDWSAWLAGIEAGLSVGTAHFLQDKPVQIDGTDYRLVDMINYLAAPTDREFIASTPYLIPVDASLRTLHDLADRGVDARVLTNSLGSTNHTIVNSHYRKYRRPILATGTSLFEFNHQPAERLRSLADVDPVRAPFISLHAKAIVADRTTSFIGSLNFDPRAIVINAENGLLIESPELSVQLADFLLLLMAGDNAWNVLVDERNALQWRSSRGSLSAQPGRSAMQGLFDLFGGLLPIESQL